MSIKMLIKDESGMIYTIEAILGIFLIMGTVIYLTNNMPYTAQKTGEHSKVQLMNIGRDALDLVEITPMTEIIPDFWAHVVYRNYTLVADKTFVKPGESVNFTVYYVGTNNIVYKNLTLEETILGLKTPVGSKTIYGSTIWNFSPSDSGDYNFRAYDANSWSNYVTIKVGYYFLDTDIDGITSNSSQIIDGVVFNSSGFGSPNLTIQVLDYNYNLKTNATKTLYGNIIEDFETTSDWASNGILNLSTTNLSGNYSLSINTSSDFWIEKTNSSYQLNKYDILSFYFYSPSAYEQISVMLYNNTAAVDKFVWNNINITQTGWNKINLNLRNPDNITGNITAGNINTIKISVSNISSNQNYLFDSLTAGDGYFSFIWPFNRSGDTGAYYIQAIDSNGNVSNKHRIIYSSSNSGIGVISSERYTIYETESTNITLTPNDPRNDKFRNLNEFNINQIFYNKYDTNKISLTQLNDLTIRFTANTSGDYYIFVGNTAQGNGTDPANGAKTNTIVIHVLPIDSSNCLLRECVMCSGFNSTETNLYMRRFIPPYVNYNLYLINTNGSICYDCYPQFVPVINGYPTAEAVTVSKIFHIDQRRNLGYLRELRMVLWYK